MAAHAAEDIQKHVRIYMTVFASLAVLTILTVAVSYLHLPIHLAIAVALAIAITKGSLVALYFMHLISEEKAIYWVLLLTASFFAVLMYMPTGWKLDDVHTHHVWDVMPKHEAAMSGHGGHAAEGAAAGEAAHE